MLRSEARAGFGRFAESEGARGVVLRGRRPEPAAGLRGLRSLEGFQERHCVWSGPVRAGSSEAPGCHGGNRCMAACGRPAGDPGSHGGPCWKVVSVVCACSLGLCRVSCLCLPWRRVSETPGDGAAHCWAPAGRAPACGLCSALRPCVWVGASRPSAVVAASLLPGGSAVTFRTNNQGVRRYLLISQGQPRPLVFHL